MKGNEHSRSWVTLLAVSALAIAFTSTSALAAPPDTAPAPKAGATKPPPKPGKAPPAKGPGGPHGKGGAGAPTPPPAYGYPTAFIERHAQQLGLSDETLKKIRDVSDNSRVESERIRKQIDEAQKQMHVLLAKDMPDEKAVMEQADKISALVGEQRKNQLRSAIKVRSLLTPEQRAELDKLRKQQNAPRHAGPGGPPPHEKKQPFGAGGAQGKPPAKPQSAQ